MFPSFPTKEAIEAQEKMKHIKSVADITDAYRLEPFILEDADPIVCPDAATEQIACNATNLGYIVCPTAMPQAPLVCPAPKQYCTTAYASTTEEELQEKEKSQE
jgi:hypothetical protein